LDEVGEKIQRDWLEMVFCVIFVENARSLCLERVVVATLKEAYSIEKRKC
jgi:hypothetical protein